MAHLTNVNDNLLLKTRQKVNSCIMEWCTKGGADACISLTLFNIKMQTSALIIVSIGAISCEPLDIPDTNRQIIENMTEQGIHLPHQRLSLTIINP